MDNKKSLTALVALTIAFNAAGCATVQKKFTRKKKEPAHRPTAIFLQEGPYQKKYSNDYYYKTHYTFWKSWHDELLDQMDGNRKKMTRCAQESVNHLEEMTKYLQPAKREELEVQLKELRRISDRIQSGNVSSSELPTMRSDLEKVQRAVNNDFYYNKVKDQLLPDTVDLDGDASPAAPASPAP